jgi:hypothetical protein
LLLSSHVVDSRVKLFASPPQMRQNHDSGEKMFVWNP